MIPVILLHAILMWPQAQKKSTITSAVSIDSGTDLVLIDQKPQPNSNLMCVLSVYEDGRLISQGASVEDCIKLAQGEIYDFQGVGIDVEAIKSSGLVGPKVYATVETSQPFGKPPVPFDVPPVETATWYDCVPEHESEQTCKQLVKRYCIDKSRFLLMSEDETWHCLKLKE